jgi:hypothetical protein
MLLINEIEKHIQKNYTSLRFILREYLQHKISILFMPANMVLILALLVAQHCEFYENQRFSEDLDFDNLGLDEKPYMI